MRGQPKQQKGRALHDVAAQARVGRERQSSRGARGVDLGRGQVPSRRELGLRRQERLLLGDETPLVRDDAPLRLDAAASRTIRYRLRGSSRRQYQNLR